MRSIRIHLRVEKAPLLGEWLSAEYDVITQRLAVPEPYSNLEDFVDCWSVALATC